MFATWLSKRNQPLWAKMSSFFFPPYLYQVLWWGWVKIYLLGGQVQDQLCCIPFFFYTINDQHQTHLQPSFSPFALHFTPNFLAFQSSMNVYRDQMSSCYFHPKEIVVGVCALCLNERLLILASRRGRHHSSARSCRKTPINLSKIFAFSSFISRLEFRHWKPENSDDEASTSQEGTSFSSLHTSTSIYICVYPFSAV